MAKSPAPIKTFGLEVFVQDVIAAIKIDPSLIEYSLSLTFETEKSFLPVTSEKLFLKLVEASVNKTLSCGLFGPEIVGTIAVSYTHLTLPTNVQV